VASEKKKVCDKVKALCCVRTEHQFKETKRELDKMLNKEGAWLEGQMEQPKWALAYDEGDFRYGIMTTNLSVFQSCIHRSLIIACVRNR
jgi:hypothetical protein